MAARRALVLRGGAAKGAFQFGAINYVEKSVKPSQLGFDYSLFVRVSV